MNIHRAQLQEIVAALEKAYHELNEIRARDGVPWTHQCMRSSVDETYFSSVVDDCQTAAANARSLLDATQP